MDTADSDFKSTFITVEFIMFGVFNLIMLILIIYLIVKTCQASSDDVHYDKI